MLTALQLWKISEKSLNLSSLWMLWSLGVSSNTATRDRPRAKRYRVRRQKIKRESKRVVVLICVKCSWECGARGKKSRNTSWDIWQASSWLNSGSTCRRITAKRSQDNLMKWETQIRTVHPYLVKMCHCCLARNNLIMDCWREHVCWEMPSP